ncbi:unnamed protein product, partial [Brenthis ino]
MYDLARDESDAGTSPWTHHPSGVRVAQGTLKFLILRSNVLNCSPLLFAIQTVRMSVSHTNALLSHAPRTRIVSRRPRRPAREASDALIRDTVDPSSNNALVVKIPLGLTDDRSALLSLIH